MTTKPADLYELLQEVRRRPRIYLRHKSLTELEAACHWYSVALGQHSVQEFGTDFHTEFSEFLLRRKRWSTCRGWASAIRQHANSPAQAWELFFRLLDQYRASREEKHP